MHGSTGKANPEDKRKKGSVTQKTDQIFWHQKKYHYLCDRFSPNLGEERLKVRK